MENISIEIINGQLAVDSRLVAERLGIKHKNFFETAKKYQTEIEQQLGQLAISKETVKNSVGAVNEIKFYYLTESQTAFLMTLSRNTDAVVEAKLYIASEFAKARKLSESSKAVLDFFEGIKGEFDKEKGGFVYLIQAKATNYCKIGVSKVPLKRLMHLQIGSPLELIVVDRIFSLEPFKLESALHSHYSDYWVRGEWFDLPNEAINSFIQSANQFDFDIEQKMLSD